MTMSYETGLRNARLDQVTSAIGSSGRIKIYAGTAPASVNNALSGNTLLADLACSATFAPSASGGQLTLNTISNDTSADATGTATFYRITTSGGTAKVQDGIASLNLPTTSIQAGVSVGLSSFTITEGNP